VTSAHVIQLLKHQRGSRQRLSIKTKMLFQSDIDTYLVLQACSIRFAEQLARPPPRCSNSCCTADPGPGQWRADPDQQGHKVPSNDAPSMSPLHSSCKPMRCSCCDHMEAANRDTCLQNCRRHVLLLLLLLLLLLGYVTQMHGWLSRRCSSRTAGAGTSSTRVPRCYSTSSPPPPTSWSSATPSCGSCSCAWCTCCGARCGKGLG
jgi:hypothetical protein